MQVDIKSFPDLNIISVFSDSLGTLRIFGVIFYKGTDFMDLLVDIYLSSYKYKCATKYFLVLGISAFTNQTHFYL